MTTATKLVLLNLRKTFVTSSCPLLTAKCNGVCLKTGSLSCSFIPSSTDGAEVCILGLADLSNSNRTN